ncbi:potassium transporter TrkG [Desulfosporosinus lacus]|uniref:Cation transport protein n=1 Tax=Desulfosporosinus lacus DSM 15449 TaxID=1121420 RepID=A0A1M5YAU1_9FIRM|nr:potassium transporter TrkG [Desulfosporosinus lacus]SHI09155.1 Cation transport protein [Desulfosporosinus lacus DSM 15449]
MNILSKFLTPSRVLVVGFALLILFGTLLLTVLFEATSAFGTVGLSLGLTPDLTVIGKIAIIITITGRVGPLTLAFVLTQKKKNQANYKYLDERMLIG